eukprot:CAMPEP_0171095424 /NCGR_PEP_ID=MMETSP0766_2-20121228/43165_1 /TAXON_ID=439317 /ORGANISM="Gambierdiscus australes, Strain CAWD 149" /LENGTH=92 /DNA_ID=CAMNT_0011554229 /DNA_START=72 /DNA_END=347 /DNA_ORIENTATION=-
MSSPAARPAPSHFSKAGAPSETGSSAANSCAAPGASTSWDTWLERCCGDRGWLGSATKAGEAASAGVANAAKRSFEGAIAALGLGLGTRSLE